MNRRDVIAALSTVATGSLAGCVDRLREVRRPHADRNRAEGEGDQGHDEGNADGSATDEPGNQDDEDNAGEIPVIVDALHGVVEVQHLDGIEEVEVTHEAGACTTQDTGVVEGCVLEGYYEVGLVEDGERRVIQTGEAGPGPGAEDGLVHLDVDRVGSDETYYQGSRVTLTAHIAGTEMVTDASVKARVTDPDGETTVHWFHQVDRGSYRAYVDLDDDLSGRYEAVVTATARDGRVQLRDRLRWEVAHAPPLKVTQEVVPAVEPGSEAEFHVVLEPEALLGTRSITVNTGETVNQETMEALPAFALSIDREDASHLVDGSEEVEVPVTAHVPEDADSGLHRTTVGIYVDDAGLLVDYVEVQVP